MQKARINITLDADLINFVKEYAESQRTTVSEVFTQFALKLKRLKENDDAILRSPIDPVVPSGTLLVIFYREPL